MDESEFSATIAYGASSQGISWDEHMIIACFTAFVAMHQKMFTDWECDNKKRKTRRERLLERMDEWTS